MAKASVKGTTANPAMLEAPLLVLFPADGAGAADCPPGDDAACPETFSYINYRKVRV